MTVLIFEDNLIWSSRLALSIKKLGHTAQVVNQPPEEIPPGDAAILNLGSQRLKPDDLAPRLKEAGLFVVGHAGHKEKPLLELGSHAGCDLVVSNSTLTFKMAEVLAQAGERPSDGGQYNGEP